MRHTSAQEKVSLHVVHHAAKATASDAHDQYKIISNMYIFSSFSLFSCVHCFLLMVYGLASVSKVHVRNHFSLEPNMYMYYHGYNMNTWKKDESCSVCILSVCAHVLEHLTAVSIDMQIYTCILFPPCMLSSTTIQNIYRGRRATP